MPVVLPQHHSIMLQIAGIGVIVTILTAIVIVWWNVPLRDVAIETIYIDTSIYRDVKDPLNPVSLTRSIVGQLFLMITSFSYAYFSTIVVSCIIWYHWFSKQKRKLSSSTILKIISGSNPIIWFTSLKVLGWMAIFHGTAIILIVIAPVLLHTSVGYMQSKITMNHTAIVVVPEAPFTGLPANLQLYKGDLNGSDVRINILNQMISTVLLGYANETDFYGTLSIRNYKKQFEQGPERDYNFFTTIPVVNSNHGYFALHTNSTYEILNTTHIRYNINTDNGLFCSVVNLLPEIITVWYWIGCTTDGDVNHIFRLRPPTTLPIPLSGFLDITDGSGNLTTLGITYNIKYKCYQISYDVATLCEDPALSTVSYLNVTDTLTPILSVLNTATYNPNLTSSVPLNFVNALHINSTATTIQSNEQFTSAGNLFLTYILWALNYVDYNNDGAQTVTPYIYNYYTMGKLSNFWFLICAVPIIITLMACYAIRNAPKKVVSEIITSYWLLNVILQSTNSHQLLEEDAKANEKYWTAEDFFPLNSNNNNSNINSNIDNTFNIEDEKLL
ncbi:unnamed protein product [Cunninghamella blakesleeana]